MSERVKTGIVGFDELIEGGLPKSKTILLSGTPGTGKTIFSLEYLYNGATRYGEKGLYISFEENKNNLYSQAKKFGWDFNKLEDEKKVFIMSIPSRELDDKIILEIFDYILDNNISRLVIDSISALAINIPSTHGRVTDINDLFVKRYIYNFINDIHSLSNVTTILISQTIEGQLSRDGVSEFAADGVVLINYESIGADWSRHLMIRKMRETKNDEDIHPLEISSKGIVIHSLE